MMREALRRVKEEGPADPIGAFVAFMSLEKSRRAMDYRWTYSPPQYEQFSMSQLVKAWSKPSWRIAGVEELITEIREAVTPTTNKETYGKAFWKRMEDTPKPAWVDVSTDESPPKRKRGMNPRFV